MRLAGKVALITGSGQGIGRATALRLAEDGADVVVVDVNGDLAKSTAADVEAKGRKSLAIQADVVDRSQVQRMVEQVVDAFGRIDILVNNAGGSTPPQRPGAPPPDSKLNSLATEDVPEDYFSEILRLNVTSALLVTQAVLPVMKRQKSGRIVNLSSILGRTGLGSPSGVAYSTAKAGVAGFTRHLAAEVAGCGITVNAIAPGIALTERVERLYVSGANSWSDEQLKRTPLGRFSKPAEQASVIAFLASDDASYITGAVVDVNGGWFIG